MFVVALNFVLVPLLIRAFGTEVFGIITLTWMVLANFSWFDFGFSRATARYVSRELSNGNNQLAAQWAWTALISQTLLGLIAASLMYGLTPRLVELLHLSPQQKPLAMLAFSVLAFAIPFDFASRSLIGVIQAGQRFDLVNGLVLFNSLLTFLIYGWGILRGADFRFVIH